MIPSGPIGRFAGRHPVNRDHRRLEQWKYKITVDSSLRQAQAAITGLPALAFWHSYGRDIVAANPFAMKEIRRRLGTFREIPLEEQAGPCGCRNTYPECKGEKNHRRL